MNGVGVFLGPISDGAAGTAVNLKRSGKLSQGGSTPPKDDIRYFAVTVAGRRTDGFFASTVERGGG